MIMMLHSWKFWNRPSLTVQIKVSAAPSSCSPVTLVNTAPLASVMTGLAVGAVEKKKKKKKKMMMMMMMKKRTRPLAKVAIVHFSFFSSFLLPLPPLGGESAKERERERKKERRRCKIVNK